MQLVLGASACLMHVDVIQLVEKSLLGLDAGKRLKVAPVHLLGVPEIDEDSFVLVIVEGADMRRTIGSVRLKRGQGCWPRECARTR